MVILLLVIGGYWWLLVAILLMTINDALPSPKLTPSWAKSLKLRNFWDLSMLPASNIKGGEKGVLKAPG